jgi:hypothetical protein
VAREGHTGSMVSGRTPAQVEIKKTHTSVLLGIACVIALGAVAGCDNRGPAERAGEKVDHTVDTIKNGGHEPVGDSIKDDINKARDKAADAKK